jgi:cardiolipin synthase
MKLTLNIPNFLSIVRIILIPLFLYFIFVPSVEMRIWALIVFCVASLTDLFDGWSARKLQQETDFGKFLDPLADKFLVISALIAFLILDQLIPLWMMLIIVFRDILITFMRYLAIKRKKVLRTTRFGKVKTVFQMISIIVIIMVFIVRSKVGDVSLQVSSPDDFTRFGTVYEIFASDNKDKWLIIGPYCLMAIVTILTALSGLRYIITNRTLFMPSTHEKKDRI